MKETEKEQIERLVAEIEEFIVETVKRNKK